jgi:hypothetical protein
MRRIPAGLGVAAAIGLVATLSAQSPTTSGAMTGDKDHDVTVTGCLSKASSGFMLTNARVDANASSTTTAAGSTTTAGTTGSTSTTTAGAAGTAGAASPAMTWMLSGDNDLDKHVGHKISVTGKTSWDASMDHARSATANPPSTTTGATTTTSGAGAEPKLDVKSIKMISTSCS